jgi:hypothetical protein
MHTPKELCFVQQLVLSSLTNALAECHASDPVVVTTPPQNMSERILQNLQQRVSERILELQTAIMSYTMQTEKMLESGQYHCFWSISQYYMRMLSQTGETKTGHLCTMINGSTALRFVHESATTGICLRCGVSLDGDFEICSVCGVSQPSPLCVRHTIQNNKTPSSATVSPTTPPPPTSTTPARESNSQALYQKRCHFRGAIAAYEGRNNKKIPEGVLTYVRQRLHASGRHMSKVTPSHVGYVIRTCGKISKYYRCINSIYRLLTGRTVPSISHLETELLLMFGTGVWALFVFCFS